MKRILFPVLVLICMTAFLVSCGPKTWKTNKETFYTSGISKTQVAFIENKAMLLDLEGNLSIHENDVKNLVQHLSIIPRMPDMFLDKLKVLQPRFVFERDPDGEPKFNTIVATTTTVANDYTIPGQMEKYVHENPAESTMFIWIVPKFYAQVGPARATFYLEWIFRGYMVDRNGLLVWQSERMIGYVYSNRSTYYSISSEEIQSEFKTLMTRSGEVLGEGPVRETMDKFLEDLKAD